MAICIHCINLQTAAAEYKVVGGVVATLLVMSDITVTTCQINFCYIQFNIFFNHRNIYVHFEIVIYFIYSSNARIQFRLPDGAKINHTFSADDTLQSARDIVASVSQY